MTITLYLVYTVIWAKLYYVDSYLVKKMLSSTEWRPTWSSTRFVSCARCSMIPRSRWKSGTIWTPGGRLGATASGRALTLGPITGQVPISQNCEYQLQSLITKPHFVSPYSSILSLEIWQYCIYTLIYLMSIIYGIALSRYGNPNSLIIPFQAIISGGQLAGEIDTRWRHYLK